MKTIEERAAELWARWLEAGTIEHPKMRDDMAAMMRALAEDCAGVADDEARQWSRDSMGELAASTIADKIRAQIKGPDPAEQKGDNHEKCGND